MTLLDDLANKTRTFWKNPNVTDTTEALNDVPVTWESVLEASDRLGRFAQYVRRRYPETVDGIIESPLRPAPHLAATLAQHFGTPAHGPLLLKADCSLPVSGSIKARGGIYEVFAHTERVLASHGFTGTEQDFQSLAAGQWRNELTAQRIVVGSTGNLGLSIGLVAADLGFTVQVHMSADAKAWKKAMLRQRGATVFEHDGDYGEAVRAGRASTEGDPHAYFVDDEASKELFRGYAVAAIRLQRQLTDFGITPGTDKGQTIELYLPCGVGGAAGGITFGMKQLYGDRVKAYWAEPVDSPSMTLGLATGELERADIRKLGLSNTTIADGLAVATPSVLVAPAMRRLVDGCFTVDDTTLAALVPLVHDLEGMHIEPSAAAGIPGAIQHSQDPDAVKIVWLTGGALVPPDAYAQYLSEGRAALNALNFATPQH